MVYYLDRRGTAMSAEERDKLLFWFVQAGMWGRYSGSTESMMDQDLGALESGLSIEAPLEVLRLWHGALRVEPAHFTGWSLGARFYPVLYLMTRTGEARDWGTGLPLKSGLLGKMNHLEVHHIFPKAQLNKRGLNRAEINAVANFCFLTKDTNLKISDRLPEDYFPEVEAKHPGTLRSQWIPEDRELWKVENFREFLEARKILLANAMNAFMEELLHGDSRWLGASVTDRAATTAPPSQGWIETAEEEQQVADLNGWIAEHGLPPGQLAHELVDVDTGDQQAVLDLAWPDGMQEGLSAPVALLLNEGEGVIAIANVRGFRCFTDVGSFKQYVIEEVLAAVALAV